MIKCRSIIKFPLSKLSTSKYSTTPKTSSSSLISPPIFSYYTGLHYELTVFIQLSLLICVFFFFLSNLHSNQDESMEDHHSTIHENLLHKNSLNISIDNEKRTKRFLFHRRNYNNTQSLNIFNTVLWLRSKRSHMVQTMVSPLYFQ